MSTVLSRRLRKAREEFGLSQRDLGLMLGLSDKAISAYESARIVPPIKTLKKIGDQLKKPIGYFIDESTDEFSVQTRFAALERSFKLLSKQFDEVKALLGGVIARKSSSKPAKVDSKPGAVKTPPSLFS